MTKSEIAQRALMRAEAACHERLLELRDQLAKLIDEIDKVTLRRSRGKRSDHTKSAGLWFGISNVVSLNRDVSGKRRQKHKPSE